MRLPGYEPRVAPLAALRTGLLLRALPLALPRELLGGQLEPIWGGGRPGVVRQHPARGGAHGISLRARIWINIGALDAHCDEAVGIEAPGRSGSPASLLVPILALGAECWQIIAISWATVPPSPRARSVVGRLLRCRLLCVSGVEMRCPVACPQADKTARHGLAGRGLGPWRRHRVGRPRGQWKEYCIHLDGETWWDGSPAALLLNSWFNECFARWTIIQPRSPFRSRPRS